MNYLYWPYDEVTLSFGANQTEIIVDSPWLTTTPIVREDQLPRVQKLVKAFTQKNFAELELSDVNWFFGPLATYPLCYILPGSPLGPDVSSHELLDRSFIEGTPKSTLLSIICDSGHLQDAELIAQHPLFQGDWKWDVEGAIEFASTPQGIDPRSLFTVARRYHLLSATADDKTRDLYEFVLSLGSESEELKRASALMVRQNHYVTQRCNSSLTPALGLCKSGAGPLGHFINEEQGHDRILFAALKSLVTDPLSVPVTSESKILMDLLGFSAGRNFLSFAINVDAFERSSYEDSDPLARVLREGGFDKASRQIDNHKAINDEGEHENLALSFINTIAPVSRDYAIEALRISELTSNLMNAVSSGVRRHLLETDYLVTGN